MRWTVLGLLCVAAMVIPSPASAGDRPVMMVDQDGRARPGDCDGTGPAYRSVSAAVRAADDRDKDPLQKSDEDFIRVCPGIYTETVDFRGPDCSINVVGARGSRPVIRAPRHIADHPSPQLDRAVITLFQLPEPTLGCYITLRRLKVQTHGGGGTCDPIDLLASWNAALIVEDVRFVAAHPVGGPCGTYGTGIEYQAEEITFVAQMFVRDSVFRDFSVIGIDYRYLTYDAEIERNRFVLRHAVAGNDHPLAVLAFSAIIRDNVMTRVGEGSPFSGIRTGRSTVTDNVIDGAAWGITAEIAGSISRNVILGRGDPRSSTGIVLGDDAGMTAADVRGGSTAGDVSDNVVSGFAEHGILARISGISIQDNDFRGNAGVDCVDRTTGDGTSGTGNTWHRDLGGQSNPGGICRRTLATEPGPHAE